MTGTGNGRAAAEMLASNPRMTTETAIMKGAGVKDPHNRFDSMLESPQLPQRVTLPKQGLPMRVLFKHDGRPGEAE